VDRSSPLVWRKASFSAANDNCVEVATTPDGGTAVRNSKHPTGPQVNFTRSEWEAFVAGVKVGEFD
jgi:hypothetical protein